MSNLDDDLLQFCVEDDDVVIDAHQTHIKPWPILVIDDEEDVHKVTEFALKNIKLLGRPVTIDSAFSAVSAREMLQQKHYACILLDVVMETDNAGLELVDYIRNSLNQQLVRIILRTGQPGYAPELSVIEQYDINDYKSKSELTVSRLCTSLIACLRTYQQLETIDANRHGLEVILDAASNLLQKKAVCQFAKGALMQICSLLDIEEEGLFCVKMQDQKACESIILSATGRFEKFTNQPLLNLNDPNIITETKAVLTNKISVFNDKSSVLYITSPHGSEMAIHISTQEALSALDKRLLELFCIDVSIGFDTASMFEKTERLAYQDSLTALPNKTAFEEKLAEGLQQQQPLAIVLLDIDNFQVINDGLGHEIGDKVLKSCSSFLTPLFPQTTYLARISSDIFGMILYNTTPKQIEIQLLRLKHQLHNPIQIEHYQISLSFSVGVACYPEHETLPLPLFQKAGIALKQAKNTCRGSYQFFDQNLETMLVNRLHIISDLHHCIEKQQLRLHYQPQLDLKTGRIKGVEALVRWQKDDKLIPPDIFISAAESSGHIIAIGAWVLQEACRQQRLWQQQGITLCMAVNVSIRQLQTPSFMSTLISTINGTGIDPRHLELEVTESMMGNEEHVIDVLHQARKLGLEVSIDDFGTGYSSLSTLQSLPVDRLKIDREFTKNMETNPEYITIVELIINLAHKLNLGVIAEGVETEAQEQLLLSMGCDQAQGYRYAKPLPAEQLLNQINQNNWYF